LFWLTALPLRHGCASRSERRGQELLHHRLSGTCAPRQPSCAHQMLRRARHSNGCCTPPSTQASSLPACCQHPPVQPHAPVGGGGLRAAVAVNGHATHDGEAAPRAHLRNSSSRWARCCSLPRDAGGGLATSPTRQAVTCGRQAGGKRVAGTCQWCCGWGGGGAPLRARSGGAGAPHLLADGLQPGPQGGQDKVVARDCLQTGRSARSWAPGSRLHAAVRVWSDPTACRPPALPPPTTPAGSATMHALHTPGGGGQPCGRRCCPAPCRPHLDVVGAKGGQRGCHCRIQLGYVGGRQHIHKPVCQGVGAGAGVLAGIPGIGPLHQGVGAHLPLPAREGGRQSSGARTGGRTPRIDRAPAVDWNNKPPQAQPAARPCTPATHLVLSSACACRAAGLGAGVDPVLTMQTPATTGRPVTGSARHTRHPRELRCARRRQGSRRSSRLPSGASMAGGRAEDGRGLRLACADAAGGGAGQAWAGPSVPK
jgi:hypothetical protein